MPKRYKPRHPLNRWALPGSSEEIARFRPAANALRDAMVSNEPAAMKFAFRKVRRCLNGTYGIINHNTGRARHRIYGAECDNVSHERNFAIALSRSGVRKYQHTARIALAISFHLDCLPRMLARWKRPDIVSTVRCWECSPWIKWTDWANVYEHLVLTDPRIPLSADWMIGIHELLKRRAYGDCEMLEIGIEALAYSHEELTSIYLRNHEICCKHFSSLRDKRRQPRRRVNRG